MVSDGVVQVMTTHKVDDPKLKAYGRVRNTREIDEFLWSLERYFEAVGILDESANIRFCISLFK